ncbi:hypothetical protein NSERUTF1_2205 [Nocardia seriolae]|nr:hypothetical protein NSERUTF1_2205 [Nocardia seriolae]
MIPIPGTAPGPHHCHRALRALRQRPWPAHPQHQRHPRILIHPRIQLPQPEQPPGRPLRIIRRHHPPPEPPDKRQILLRPPNPPPQLGRPPQHLRQRTLPHRPSRLHHPHRLDQRRQRRTRPLHHPRQIHPGQPPLIGIAAPTRTSRRRGHAVHRARPSGTTPVFGMATESALGSRIGDTPGINAPPAHRIGAGFSYDTGTGRLSRSPSLGIRCCRSGSAALDRPRRLTVVRRLVHVPPLCRKLDACTKSCAAEISRAAAFGVVRPLAHAPLRCRKLKACRTS